MASGLAFANRYERKETRWFCFDNRIAGGDQGIATAHRENAATQANRDYSDYIQTF
jgi:hypothetical protein